MKESRVQNRFVITKTLKKEVWLNHRMNRGNPESQLSTHLFLLFLAFCEVEII